MKAFETLTKQGKARRLRALAINALKHYPFEVAKLRLMGMYTNTLFRVDTTHGKTFVLRICAPNWRTDEDLRSEALWLQALQDTDIGAPEPLPAQNGDWLVRAQAPGVIECRCTLMSWLPGRPLGKHLTEANLRKMGVLFARLHAFSADYEPADGFTRRKMDTILARGEPDVLFSALSDDAIQAHSQIIVEQTLTKVKKAFADLYSDHAGLRVIHHDLHHDNIHLYRGHLYPLDFEDTVWGYPVQDIAMALQDLMMAVPPDRFDTLVGAFCEGYEYLQPWPECHNGQIDTFRAGRMLWVTNYVALREREYLDRHIKWLTPIFERYLNTRKLRLQ
jgi:Ser/Thr protein kinase RdoA (MazF antagonist)